MISNDPTGDGERISRRRGAVQKEILQLLKSILTLLDEYGLSVIAPAVSTVPPLVIRLIHRPWAHLSMDNLAVINENKEKCLETHPGVKTTTWQPSCAAF